MKKFTKEQLEKALNSANESLKIEGLKMKDKQIKLAKSRMKEEFINKAKEKARDDKKRNITRDDVAVEALKKELKRLTKGRTMVRQDGSYKRDEARGIYTWAVYFDDPRDRDVISKAIAFGGFYPSVFRVVGGSYGYVLSFRTKVGEFS